MEFALSDEQKMMEASLRGFLPDRLPMEGRRAIAAYRITSSKGAFVRIHWLTSFLIRVLSEFHPVFVPLGTTLWRGMIVTPMALRPLALMR